MQQLWEFFSVLSGAAAAEIAARRLLAIRVAEFKDLLYYSYVKVVSIPRALLLARYDIKTTANTMQNNNLDADEKLESVYSDEGFYEHYETVRRELRKYDTVKLVDGCLSYLHAPIKEQIDYLRRHPWLILLLIKWALIDERAFKHGRPTPTWQQMSSILQLMHDFGRKSIARMPSQFQHTHLFMRAIGSQQFIYQHQATLTAIARQQLYFETTSPSHYIRETFLNLTGIDVLRFLELAQVLLFRFQIENQKRINVDWFSTLYKTYPEEEVSIFLNNFSKSLSRVREALIERDRANVLLGRPTRSPAEYWEQTPFINYPLVKTGKSYVCIEEHVLFRGAEHYIYNLLRSYNAKVLMAHFGPLFEEYVGKAIAHIGLPFIRETEIKETFGHESNAIDFILVDDGANIFVDAKGVEISYQGKSTHDATELVKWLETSVLKAIKQAHKVMSRLPENASPEVLMRSRKRNYLITVTYSELYVSSGRNLAEIVGTKALEPFMNSMPKDSQIPLSNMLFMTIKEFELLSEVVRSKQISLTNALDFATTEDRDPKTQKFEFWQHLVSTGAKLEEPTYLTDKANSEIEALARRLQQ